MPKSPRKAKAVQPARVKTRRPSSLISLSLLICERVLTEADAVMSAVRIVDVFFVTRIPELPPEKQAVPMQALLVCKFRHGDKEKHTMQLQLERPDRTIQTIGDVVKDVVGSSRFPEAPGGFNIAVQAGIIPKQLGTHYIVVLLDGVEVAREPFTLLERKLAATN